MNESEACGTKRLEELVLPLHAEQITVDRVTRRTGRVRIATVTRLHEHVVDEALVEEHAQVERVAIDRLVDAMPEIRQEGDTTIVPVVEEVLVVERRLFLKQEIRITRTRTSSSHREAFLLRAQEAVVTRETDNPQFERMVNSMASETIVAVFPSLAHAEAAISDLVNSGVPSASIRHYARDHDETYPAGADPMDARAETEIPESGTQHRHGFWAWLTGEDSTNEHHATYDRSIESGRTVVTVISDASNVEHIHATLERHDPLDLDDHDETLAGREPAGVLTPGAATQSGAPGSGMTGGVDAVAPAGQTYAQTRTGNEIGTGTEIGSGTGGEAFEQPGVAGTGRANFEPRTTAPVDTARTGASRVEGTEEVIPLSEETLEVGKRAVDRGTTRVRRYVVERPVEEQIRLRDETVSVFRRPASGSASVGTEAFRDREVVVNETSEEAVVGKTVRVVEEVVVQKGVEERVETVHDTVRHDEVEIDGRDGKKTGREPGSAI